MLNLVYETIIASDSKYQERAQCDYCKFQPAIFPESTMPTSANLSTIQLKNKTEEQCKMYSAKERPQWDHHIAATMIVSE
jgi:hypothetical protein